MRLRKVAGENRAGEGEAGDRTVPRHVFLGKGNGVFSHNRLPCGCVSRNKDRVMPFQV